MKAYGRAAVVRALASLLGPLLLGVLTTASPRPASADAGFPGTGSGFRYEVTPSPDLGRMRVTIRFRGFRPRRVAFSGEAAMGHVRVVAGRLVAAPDGRSFFVGGLDPTGALSYEIDLDGLLEEHGRLPDTLRLGRDRIVWPGLVLLRPALWPATFDVDVSLLLPPGVEAAVPWTPTGRGTWSLEEHDLLWEGPLVLGEIAKDAIDVGGAHVEIARLAGPLRATSAGIRRWLEDAASPVARFFGGRFPVPRLLVIVEPVGSARAPVVFGRTTHGGGPALRLLLSSSATDDELPGEWVGVHEMMHLGLPIVRGEDAWFSEGVVTWYQELLRARAGYETPEQAWQALVEGLGRGRRSATGRTLAEESARMHETHNFYRVYWGGVLFALDAELSLRRATGGRVTLDDVIRHWHVVYGTPTRLYAAEELLAEADEWLGRPILVPIARRHLSATTFPDVQPYLRAAGVDVDAGGRVHLAEDSIAVAVTRLAAR